MNVKPCCVFKNFETPVIYDENKTILESLNTDQFKNLRQDLNNEKTALTVDKKVYVIESNITN
jgi:hypothetical protein